MRAPSKNRFLRLLRKTAQSSQKTTARTSPAEENALWVAHERAFAGSQAAQESAQRMVATCAKQRTALDGLADAGRVLAAHAQELERHAARSVDAFERLSIVALNSSLEATRLGEAQGRALALVSDEVRVHAMRGSENARSLAGSAHEVQLEAGALASRAEEARGPAADLGAEALRGQSAVQDVERALSDMKQRLRKQTGSDPETVRAMSEAAEHARALVAALGTLSGRVPRSLLLSVLGPMLEPLLRAVDDEGEPQEAKE